MNVNMAARPCPSTGRDYDGGHHAGHPLNEHQTGKHPIRAPVNRLLTFMEQDICSLFNGLADSKLFLGSVIHSFAPDVKDFGVHKAHPKTGVRLRSAIP